MEEALIEVSTFELLVKPIAPRSPSNPVITTVARRVVQGYFLTISNLEQKNLRFRIEYLISLPTAGFPDAAARILEGNAVLLFDTARNNLPLTLNRVGTTNRYLGSFTVPAGQTASVQLLPNLAKPGLLEDPNPQLEIRGYVSLFLPPIFIFDPENRRFGFESQSSEPVKVLLNPEVRGTFLPNDLNTAELDFDQINYTLELASGKALNLIPPEPPFLLPVGRNIDRIRAAIASGELDLASLEVTEPQKAQMLVELLAQLDRSPANLDALNGLMSELGIPLNLSAELSINREQPIRTP